MGIFKLVLALVKALVVSRTALAAENLALRHQLAVLKRSTKRPRLRPSDRVLWVWLSRIWGNWHSVVVLVKPETVVRWHRQGFRIYWRRKSKAGRIGRPSVQREIRDLLHRMCRENPTWGAPRIQSELRLLGYDVAESTVAKYMRRRRKPPSQTWRTFLANQESGIAAVDFFTVPTVTFQILFCFLVLRHGRRKVVHFNITESPTAAWTAQQVIEAFPYDEAPRFLLRDRDSIYGQHFRWRVQGMGTEEVLTAPRSPWQNPYVERLIGSIRRECLDHVIILGEDHLRRLLSEYLRYYHDDRCHLSLERNAPNNRPVEPPGSGRVVSEPRVGGLHHRYRRVA